MAKFIKKPIEIEANQWFPPDDSRHNPEHQGRNCMKILDFMALDRARLSSRKLPTATGDTWMVGVWVN